MINELLVVWAIFLSGALFIKSFGLRGWPVLPAGFLLGTVLFTSAASLQALLGIEASYFLPLVMVLASASLWWLLIGRNTPQRFKNLEAHLLIGCLALLSLIVFIVWELNILVFATDTVRQSMASSLLASGNIEYLSDNLAIKRINSVSILNSLADLYEAPHIISLPPLISLSTLASFAWLMCTALKNMVRPKRTLAIACIMAVSVMATNYGFWWHSFYQGTHILHAGLLLLAVVCGWLLVTKSSNIPERALAAILLTASFGVVLTRPEAALLLPFALLPIILYPRVSVWIRKSLLASLGLSMMLQQGLVIYPAFRNDFDYPRSSLLIIFLGVFMLVSTFFINIKLVRVNWARILIIVETGLWLVLLAFVINDPAILLRSVPATIKNILFGYGLWGLSYAVLVFLFFLTFFFKPIKQYLFLRYPLTTFIPLGFLVAYLREGGYRPGVYDTFNRMFMHILPLLMMYIVLTLYNSALEDKDGSLS